MYHNYIGHTLSQNFWENQRKMQRHICLEQTIGWTHQFQEGVKVQRFFLTLVREAELWYECPINIDWQGLQNQFRQQYSKIGNT